MKPTVSLIVVSQKRPIDLERLLASLVYQSLQNYEILVVADRPPIVSKHLNVPVRFYEMLEANISKARNIGIKHAKAPLIAFCDDDAVPDPYWLERLIAPFYQNEQIGAAGGWVRGRNGISYQWKSVGFTKTGEDFDISTPSPKRTQIFQPDPARYIKCVGTNSAYRTDLLYEMGGFDEGFFYYLEDADINKRLQDAGYLAAIVPNAQIIHNYSANRGRSAARVPQSLYNLGASTHLFLRKHCQEDARAVLVKLEFEQKERLLNFFNFGLVSPRKMQGLLRDLKMGIEAGQTRSSMQPFTAMPGRFQLVPPKTRSGAFVLSNKRPESIDPQTPYVRKRILLTTFAAQLRFNRGGYWLITMGIWGKFTRKEKLFTWRSFKSIDRQIRDWLSAHFHLEEKKP